MGVDTGVLSHSLFTPLTPGKYNPNMSDSDFNSMWADVSSSTGKTFTIPKINLGGNKRKPKVKPKNP